MIKINGFYTFSGGDLMEVINYDKDGNLIPDLSKKVMPLDVSRVLIRMIYEAEKEGKL